MSDCLPSDGEFVIIKQLWFRSAAGRGGGGLPCLFTQANVTAACVEYNERFVGKQKFTNNSYTYIDSSQTRVTFAYFSQEGEGNTLDKVNRNTIS